MTIKKRITTLEKKTAADPVKVTFDWGMEDDGKIEYNGERLTLEEARAKYPKEKFIVFEWGDAGQDEKSPE